MRRCLALLAALAWAVIARADGSALHEYVPDLDEDEGTILVSSGGPEPEALVYGGEVIPAPNGGGLRDGERALRAAPAVEDPSGDPERREMGRERRAPSFRPDRVTALNGRVNYFEIFTPTISPYKRLTALDSIVMSERVPVLTIADRGPRTRVEVVGAQAQAPDGRPRDRFWGSVVLDFGSGPEIAFPSVSPESRILTMRVEPDVLVHLERDGADNFYAVLDQPGSASEVRVTFLTDAPRTYFGVARDGSASLPRSPTDSLAAEVTPLPPALQRRALEFAATLGVSGAAPFDQTLSRLTEWFRSFEESQQPPDDTGDVYWDLATGRRGVCRHRAYAFVITAHALGIPARFVNNEAHAWVEVHLPEQRGWLRIDLGGSPRGLSAHNTGDRPAYRPGVLDPLPRPPEYVRAYQQASQQEGATAGDQGVPRDREQGGESGGGPEGERTDRERREASGEERGQTQVQGDDPEGAAAPPQRSRTARVEEGTAEPERRRPLALQLDLARQISVMRGQQLEIAGSARSEEEGVEGLRIEVLLAATRGTAERFLGVTVTHEHGLFRASFGVPPDLAAGDYRLVVRSPGDAHVGPALAQ